MKIDGIDKVESVIGEWSPRDLAIVSRVIYDSEKAELSLYGACQKRSKSWPDFDGGFDKVLLVFQGVSNLHLKEFGQGDRQIMGFDIKSPSVKGGLYEVEDYEDRKIEFVCNFISIMLI